MAFLPYPRCPPNSFRRTHSKFVCASPPTEFTEYTEASGVEEPPTDAHRCTQMVRLRRVLPRISQMYTDFSSPPVVSVFREFCGKIVLWLRGYGRDAIPS